MRYSASTGGWYLDSGDAPRDAVSGPSVDAVYAAWSHGMPGKILSTDANGHPTLIDPPGPTPGQISTAARSERNAKLAQTDYLLMPDYPISDEVRARVLVYRQDLRDITSQPGFPAAIQWPETPV